MRRAGDYPWSSHRAYAGIEAPSTWLDTDFVLSVFARGRQRAQMAYRQFIADVAADPELPPVDAANGDVLGDDDFTSRVTNRPPIPRPAGLTLEELVKERAASLSQVARFLRRDRATLRYAMRQHAGSLE